MWSAAGRSEDIYASYVWQKFLFNNDMHAHVGDAVNYSDRGKRNDLRDLALEVETYLKSHEVWEEINKIQEKDSLTFINKLIHSNHEIISRERGFMHAFRTDLERILFKLSPKKQNVPHRQVSSRGRRTLPSRATLSNRKDR